MIMSNNSPRWQLSRRWRQLILVVHLMAAGIWLGVDVVVAILVLTGWFAEDIALRSLSYRALANFVALPMMVSGLVCLVTGVLLGLATRWGLVRYWWVMVKLVLTVVLCTLIVLVLQPGMSAVDTYGQELLTSVPDRAAQDRVRTLFFPPAVSLSALTFAMVLAVVKPWGRLVGGRHRRG